MTSVKCKNCGAEILPYMKFCGVCGTTAAETGDTAAASESGSATSELASASTVKKAETVVVLLMKFILAAIVIGAFIASAGILFSLRPPKYIQSSLTHANNENDRVIIVAGDEGKTIMSLEGLMGGHSLSLEGKVVALLIYTGSTDDLYEGSFEGYSLYHVADKATLIADGVFEAVIATSGEGIVFSKVAEGDSSVSELCIWSGGKIDTITMDYVQRYGAAISPDGQTVAYTGYDEDEEKYVGYYYNGKETALGKDIRPFAIANGAKYVYYGKEDAIYVQKGADSNSRNKLGEDIDGSDFYFNSNLTSVIYNNDTESYISRNGGEKASLPGLFAGLLLPNGAAAIYDGEYTVYGVNDFAETFYRSSGGSVIYIDSKYETDKVASSTYKAQLAQDGKTVTYWKGDSIYKVNGMKENAEEIVLVEEGVCDFIAASNGKAIYFYNTDEELMFQEGTGKPVQVDEDLEVNNNEEEYPLIWTIFGRSKLFYASGEELYWSTGSKGTGVKGIDEEIYYITMEGKKLLVATYDDDGYYVYVSFDGVNFELISEYFV